MCARARAPTTADACSLRSVCRARRFVRQAGDDADGSWEQRVAKQYYDRLYKEYCLADLMHYKSGQVRCRALLDVLCA